MSVTGDSADSLIFLPAGKPGRLGKRRAHVQVQYADGCVSTFPPGFAVTVEMALLSHQRVHEKIASARGESS